MELFKRRFLALICFLSVMTLIFALNLNSSAIIILLAVLSLGLPTSLIALTIFSRLSKNDGKHRATVKKLVCFIIYILISSVMLVGAYSFVSKSEYINSRIGKEVTIKGRVTEVRKRTSALSSFEVELLYIGENDTSIKAILEIPAHSTLKRTDEFTAVGKLSGISFGDEYYFMADGFQAKLNCESRSDVTLRSVTLENTETIFQRINLFFQEILNQVTGNSDKGSFINTSETKTSMSPTKDDSHGTGATIIEASPNNRTAVINGENIRFVIGDTIEISPKHNHRNTHIENTAANVSMTDTVNIISHWIGNGLFFM